MEQNQRSFMKVFWGAGLALALVVAGLAVLFVLPTTTKEESGELTAVYEQYKQHYARGRYGEAEVHARKAIELSEAELGPEHKTTAILINNLATVHELQGRYAEAEGLYKRALTIKEKVLGPEHISVGATLNNLALLLDLQHRYGEAEPLYLRALRIMEKALGPKHPSFAISLDNLGVMYSAQGRYGEAEPLNVRALAILEEALGAGQPWVQKPDDANVFDTIPTDRSWLSEKQT